jgi:hypothetical protein
MKNKYLGFIFKVSVAVYLVVALFYFLSKQAGGGDEALFLADLHLIDISGWTAAVQKGISIPYLLLAYPVSQLLEPFIALRWLNVSLFAALLLYFYKVRGVRQLNFYGLLLFFYSTVGYFLAGTNDTLFIICLVIFIVETHSILSATKKSSLFWWGTSLVIAVFTRELIMVYVPVILLALFFILKQKKFQLRSLWFPILLLGGFLILNIPSLSQNGTLSYDQKLPPESTTVTWPQRQYYAQLLVNEGKIPNYNHPNWEQTQEYLDKNGQESLPKSVVEGMLFDPAMTLKEFFKDLFYIFAYGGRQLGLMLVVVLLFFLKRLVLDRKLTAQLFIPMAVLLMSCIFALIIISYVELRWLSPVFIATIFYFYRLVIKQKIPRFLVRANYVVITAFCWYGIVGIITKL